MVLKEISKVRSYERKCAIIMPAYNEEEALPRILPEWLDVVNKIGGTLVIINDGSRDSTLDVLTKMAENRSRLIILDKPNSGHGQTCLSAYRWAIENNFEWIFQTDSDGQIKASDFLSAWGLREYHDFIFGFRPIRGDGMMRWIISRVLRLVIFCAVGVSVKDANVPFRLMKSKELAPYLSHIPSKIFLANAFLTVLLTPSNKIHWMSISFNPRQGGVPSVSLKKFFILGIRVAREFWELRSVVKKVYSRCKD